MSWFRVRLDLVDGRILSCEPCSVFDAQQGAWEFIVEATGETDARTKAYKLYLAAQRAASRERKRANQAAGLCRCGREPKPGRKQCQVCLVSSEQARERMHARTRGEHVVTPSKSIAFARRAEEKRQETRLQVLTQVHGAWCRSKTAAEFTAWLRAELESARKG